LLIWIVELGDLILEKLPPFIHLAEARTPNKGSCLGKSVMHASGYTG
jgi:hypothetical protein